MLKPNVLTVLALTSDVIERASQLYQSPVLDPGALEALVRDKGGKSLGRIDDPDRPFIKADAQGRQTMYQLWGHPKNPIDPEFAVILVCPETGQGGQSLYRPEKVLRGPKANVLIVGGMSCCGSMQTHWTQMREGGQAIDAARVPVSGLVHDEDRNWLKGKIHVASSPQGLNAIQHLILDVLAQRFPNDARFNHACDTKGDYVSYGQAARVYGL